MIDKQCKDCKYFYEYEYTNKDLRKGYCTRFPEWKELINKDYFGGLDISETHWCGEWVQK